MLLLIRTLKDVWLNLFLHFYDLLIQKFYQKDLCEIAFSLNVKYEYASKHI